MDIIQSNSDYYGYINIYTDASDKILKNNNNKEVRVTSPGFIATYGSRIVNQRNDILLNQYTIFGEIEAIKMALEWILYVRNHFGYIGKYNIFSDSNSVVIMINKKIKEIRESMGKKLKQPAYSPNTTKDSAYCIAYMIVMYGIDLTIYYVPSHIPIYNNNFKSYNKYKKKFIEFNKTYHSNLERVISDQMIFEAATFNNIIDIVTRNYLIQFIKPIEYDIKYNIPENILFDKNNVLAWPCSIVDNKQIELN